MLGRSRRIITYMIVLIGLVMFFLFYYQNFIASYFMGMKIVDQEEFDAIIQSGTPLKEEPPVMYWNQAVCYDKESDTYYVSQTLEALEFEGELMVSDCETYILEDTMFEKKAEAIEQAHVFQIAAVSEEGIASYKVVFSGMPTIRLDRIKRPVHAQKGESYGTITVFEPGAELEKAQSCYVSWNPRGNTALNYDKKGYKVNLYNEDWVSEKRTFLGLRKDNDWILNAMYTDSTKVREKLAMDIWEIISESNYEINEGGSHMEYVEVFIDDQYRGLYGLSEPLDAKQLELDEDDILYKIVKDQYMPVSYELERKEYNVVESVELIYPKEMNASMWKPLADFLWFFSEGKVWEDAQPEDVYYHTKLSNVADRQIFDQLIYHMDARLKNEYFVARYSDNDYDLILIPWDYNLSFGDCWVEDTITNTCFSLKRSSKLFDNPKNDLWKYYDEYLAEEYYDYLDARWKELQELGLTEEELVKRLKEYSNYLAASGALQRDSVKWPECGNSSDVKEIEIYLAMKIPYLTQYIESRGIWPVESD